MAFPIMFYVACGCAILVLFSFAGFMDSRVGPYAR